MSGLFPSTIGFMEASIQYDQPTHTTYSESGKSQSRVIGGHLWRGKLSSPPMTTAQIAPYFTFTAKQHGDSFTIAIPPHNNALGTASGSVTVNDANADKGDKSVTIAGLTGSLLEGDMFTFATHTKVYMVTADRSGAGVLSFTPGLTEDVADTTAITYDGVVFTMRLDGDLQTFKTNRQSHSTYQHDLIEAST